MSEQTTRTSSSEPKGKPAKRALRPQTVALLAIAVVFGLLLWAKLLLVTGHPRTALADPEARQPAAGAQPTSQRAAAAD